MVRNMKRRGYFRFLLVLAAAIFVVPTVATGDTVENSFAGDPSVTIKYLPGKYFEQQALDAAQHKHFRRALEMYEKAAYWGNKIAQYDVGMLYLNGADGVAVDKTRGIAWLGIAAQRHAPYVDKALADAYASADASLRAAAGALWKQLMIDYDDKVTLDRATKHFNAQYLRDKGQIIGPAETATMIYGNFGGGGGDQGAQGPVLSQVETVGKTPDSHVVNAARFLTAMKDQFSDFVQTQFGVVTVGEPETISEREQRESPPAAPAKH